MKLRALLTAALLAAALTGCTARAQDDGIKVAAAFYPLEFAAQQVAGTGVSVVNLTTPGQDAHESELTTRQMADLSSADLVVYLAGFQPAIDAAVATNKPAHVLEVSSVVRLETTASEGLHGDMTGQVDPSSANYDPHFWLDPMRLAAVSQAIAVELGKIDPDHASTYTDNANSAEATLASLDGDMKGGLANCQRHEIFTAHAAFGYLAERYGLNQVAVAGLSPSEEPSPARIAEVQKLAKEHQATTIFFETLTSDAVAKSIAQDLGLKTAVLDPIEGITSESAGNTYPAIMRSNLEAIRAANDCS